MKPCASELRSGRPCEPELRPLRPCEPELHKGSEGGPYFHRTGSAHTDQGLTYYLVSSHLTFGKRHANLTAIGSVVAHWGGRPIPLSLPR